jgi:aldehyde dehydrogenase (NAD+)
MTTDLLRTRHPFLDDKPKRMLIDGKWLEAASGKTFASINPSTGEVLARVAEGDAEDIDRAVAAARRAFNGPWSKFKPAERQALLLKLADIVEQNFDELAALDTLDMGGPINVRWAAARASSACCATTRARQPRSTVRRSRIRCPARMSASR